MQASDVMFPFVCTFNPDKLKDIIISSNEQLNLKKNERKGKNKNSAQ